MTTFSSFGGAHIGGVPHPGFVPGGLPSAMSFRPPGGVGFDADPITPGNQTTPGVVTATGPTRFAGGPLGGIPGGVPGGIGLPTISTRPGFAPGGFVAGGFGGVVDADPITPGIQSQPGVVTTLGPPRVVSGPGSIGGAGFGGAVAGGFTGGFAGGLAGGVVDADPITPGIQSQPGVVTPIGPPRVVSGPRPGPPVGFGNAGVGYGAVNTNFATRTVTTGGQIGSIVSGSIPSVVRGSGMGVIGGALGAGGIIDADPITPGIQSQPGVVTPIGPPRIVSGPGAIGGINTTITSGIAGGFGGVVDADPITPGIQSQPGIVTTLGPPQIVSTGYRTSGVMNNSGFAGGVGGGMLSSGLIAPQVNYQTTTAITATPMLTSGVFNSGIQQNSYGVVDADPITPGIQLQPGVLTATGITTMLTSGLANTFPTGFVDADPITPGIQLQPGTITQTGPTTVISGGNLGFGSIAGVNTLQQSFGGVVDADPITPGIQSTPGVITQVGPSVVVGRVNSGVCGCLSGCPWWLWPLLGLLLLGGLIGGLYACFRPKEDREDRSEDDKQERTVKTECSGYLNANGDCVACPVGSEWNGKTCTYTAAPETVSEKTTVTAEEGETPSGDELPESVTSESSGETSAQSEGKKVPVFAEQENDQAIDAALKGASSEGVAPTVITSKPTPSQPSSVIDASTGSATSGSSQYTSTNVVTVPAITQRKSVAPTITYSASTNSGASSSGSSSGASGRSTYVSRFSSSGGQSGSSGVTTTTKTVRRVTRTITSHRDQAVEPISSDPAYKHLKRTA